MLAYLQEHYPGLAHFYVCKITGDDGLFSTDEYFKKFEDKGENYSLYVHGYLLPALKKLEIRGHLREGKCDYPLEISGKSAFYEG